MTYAEKPATGSNNVYFGIEWNESNGTTAFTIQPTIYRWDRQSTSNSGGRWSEDITKTSGSGTDSWSGLTFKDGSGYRTIDTFSKRSYSKGHSAQTITYHLYTDANFGTYYNGWTTLGAQTWTFTMTIPAKASYTVAFNANGGSGQPGNQTKWYGEALTLSSTKPTRSNYTFKQWNTKSDGTGTAYASGASYTGNAALTLYAIWTPNTYTISYNANGGSGTTSSQTKTYGVNLTLRSNNFTRTNYVFKNWNTNSGGTGTSYSAGGSYTANAAATLYAQWYAPYTISFNANGGSGAPSAQTKIYNKSLTLSSTVPTRTGYNFKKWNTVQGGTGTNYNPGASYTANAAATLYAQWEVAHYAPTISSLRVQRCDSNGTLNPEGTCCKVTCSWSVDNTTAGYTSTTGSKMKVKVDSYSEVQVNISGTSGTTEYVYSANSLSIGSTHSVNVTIVDTASANNSSSRSATLTRAFFTMHFKDGGTGIGIGKVSETDNLLDIGVTTRLDNKALWIDSPNIDRDGAAPSSDAWGAAVILRDKDAERIGTLTSVKRSNGRMDTGLYVYGEYNGTEVSNSIILGVNADGTRYVYLTESAPWRSALLLNTWSSVSFANFITFTSGAGWSNTSTSIKYNAALGIVRFYANWKTSTAKSGNITIGTIGSDYRPKDYTVAVPSLTSASEAAYINTLGEFKANVSVAANGQVYFCGEYHLGS